MTSQARGARAAAAGGALGSAGAEPLSFAARGRQDEGVWGDRGSPGPCMCHSPRGPARAQGWPGHGGVALKGRGCPSAWSPAMSGMGRRPRGEPQGFGVSWVLEASPLAEKLPSDGKLNRRRVGGAGRQQTGPWCGRQSRTREGEARGADLPPGHSWKGESSVVEGDRGGRDVLSDKLREENS